MFIIGQCTDATIAKLKGGSNFDLMRIDDLKGHIYDVGYGQQADAFVKTTEEIAGYADRTCKKSRDIRPTIEKL